MTQPAARENAPILVLLLPRSHAPAHDRRAGAANPSPDATLSSHAPAHVTHDPFFKFLRTHYPQHRVRVPDAPSRKLQQALEEILSQELEESTWEGYARTWSEMERYFATYGLLYTELNASLFLVAIFLDKTRKMSIGTLYQYAKQISAVGGRLPEESGWADGTLRRVKKVLVKMGALIPEQQALPFTIDDLEKVLTGSRLNEDQRMLILLGFLTASRADDLSKALAADAEKVRVDGRWVIVVRWRPRWAQGRGSGRLKNSRNGVGHSCVVDAGSYTDRLWMYVRRRQGKSMSDLDATGLGKLLQKINSEYSGHSLKRGCLTEMLMRDVPIHLIIRMARHAHPSVDLPIQTKLYLPSIPLALALQTHVATKAVLPPSALGDQE